MKNAEVVHVSGIFDVHVSHQQTSCFNIYFCFSLSFSQTTKLISALSLFLGLHVLPVNGSAEPVNGRSYRGGYMSPNFPPLYFCTSAETRPKKKNHPEPPETRAETNRNPGGDMSAETVNTSEKLTNLQKLGLRHSRGNCQHLRELHEPAETRAATLPRKLSTPQRN